MRGKAVRRGLLTLALGLGWVYGTALWITRGACPGLEHLLEALIALVTWRLPWQALLGPAVLLGVLLCRRVKTGHFFV